MKKSNLLIILTFFCCSIFQAQESDSNRQDDNIEAGYVKSFFSIKDLLESIENTFINTVTKEKKDKIITQITFLSRDMVSLKSKKMQLFNCSINNSCIDMYEIVTFIKGDFYQINERLVEINKLCANKYQRTTDEIASTLKTNLNSKERDMDKIMRDLTGKEKYNKQELTIDRDRISKITTKCIEDIDKIIFKMKENN